MEVRAGNRVGRTEGRLKWSRSRVGGDERRERKDSTSKSGGQRRDEGTARWEPIKTGNIDQKVGDDRK